MLLMNTKKTLDDLAPSYAYDQHRGVMFTWDATYKKGQVMEPGTDVLKKKNNLCQVDSVFAGLIRDVSKT